MKEIFKDKKILITGGAGFVGRKIVYEILKYDPETIRIFDTNETAEFEMQEDLRAYPNIRFLLGDIRDKDRLIRAIEDIDIVYHMASYKHVLSCEYNPFEAVKTNVTGTQNLIDVAIKEEVEKFIFTSSDKAVNPHNVMGATKLLAERLVTAANYHKGPRRTIFSSVRFGNILGSSGSVVPLFQKQIQKGWLTITDPNMTRFVMSTSQLVSFLFRATQIAQGGEIFIFKMPSVKILDLAHVVIEELSPIFGNNANEIELKIVGRKPGEKLHEELMTRSEAERSLETKDMFIILPEIMLDLHIDITCYPNAKNTRLMNSYESNNAHILTKQEIKELLYECGVLEKTNTLI